jgi:membrane protease YdiL (CAAX protease family)
MDEKIKSRILLFALISEGTLAGLALGWYYLSVSKTLTLFITTNDVIFGLIALTLLIVINGALYIFASSYQAGKNQLKIFSDTVVAPLCRSLNLPSAALISLAAGIAEELFFRGFLTDFLSQYLSLSLAIFIANLLFAYLHLIGAIKRFFAVFLIYLSFGLFFSILTLFASGNLFPAILSHALYDFLVIVYFLKRK